MTLRPSLSVPLLALISWLGACSTPSDPETAPGNVETLGDAALKSSHGKIHFTTHVKPVLQAKCVICHNRKTLPAFSLETRALAFAMPSRIVPHHPEQSLLIIKGAHHHQATMPPVGNRLTDDEKRILTAWVAQGATWPAGPSGTLRPDADAPLR